MPAVVPLLRCRADSRCLAFAQGAVMVYDPEEEEHVDELKFWYRQHLKAAGVKESDCIVLAMRSGARLPAAPAPAAAAAAAAAATACCCCYFSFRPVGCSAS